MKKKNDSIQYILLVDPSIWRTDIRRFVLEVFDKFVKLDEVCNDFRK